MCTNYELKQKLDRFIAVSEEFSRLEKMKRAIAAELIELQDDGEIDGSINLITERLTETATKAGKEFIKENAGPDVETYLTVSLARYIDKRTATKVFKAIS